MYSAIKKTLYLILCCTVAAALFCGCQRQNSPANNSAGDPGKTNNAANNFTENISVNNVSDNITDNTAVNISDNTAVNTVSENTASNNGSENAASNNTSEPSQDGNTANTVEPPIDPVAEFRNSHSEVARTDNYILYELSFERDGMTIYGQLYLPNSELEKYPVVIVSHGFQGSFRLNTYINEAFANAGLAVYAYDFCGGSTFSLSGGSMLDMSVLTEAEDLQTVFDELRSMEFIDSSNMFLMGESQGGMVSALLAAKRPSDVAGLVLFYPAFVIPDNGRALYGTKESIPEYPYAFGLNVGRRYYLDVFEMDPFEEIESYEGNVLLIHGDQDIVVPYYYSQKALETYKNAELITIWGAGHGFTGQPLVDACNASISFIKDHLAQ